MSAEKKKHNKLFLRKRRYSVNYCVRTVLGCPVKLNYAILLTIKIENNWVSDIK